MKPFVLLMASVANKENKRAGTAPLSFGGYACLVKKGEKMNINLGKARIVKARGTSFVKGEVDWITVWVDFEKLKGAYIDINVDDANELLSNLQVVLSKDKKA